MAKNKPEQPYGDENVHTEQSREDVPADAVAQEPEFVDLPSEIIQEDIDSNIHGSRDCPGARAINRALIAAGYTHLRASVYGDAHVTYRDDIIGRVPWDYARAEHSDDLAGFVNDYDRSKANPNDPTAEWVPDRGPKAVPQTIVLRFNKAELDKMQAAAVAAEQAAAEQQASTEDATE